MNRQLTELARLHGVETSYIDMNNRRRAASTESVMLALTALGTPVQYMDDVAGALRLRLDSMRSSAEPVYVAWDGKLDLQVQPNAILVSEDGAEMPRTSRALPTGYYTLTNQAREQAGPSLVISAPRKAYSPLGERAWGVFAPVYALHSNRSFGAGDLTDLESIIIWMLGLGGRVAATLPLLGAFMDEPFDPSPYAPASRLFWNELYIDPARTPEFHSSAEARRLMKAPPPASPLIDYRTVMARKRSVLEALTRKLFEDESGRRGDSFRKFIRARPEVSDYARFRAVTDRMRAGWSAWPRRQRDGRILRSDYDQDAWRYHAYAQWILADQLSTVSDTITQSGGQLYLDLPIGLHPAGYDTWRFPEFFAKGMTGGAPPDRVFTTGQNWMFPPMHPHAMRKHRHSYTIAVIRNHLKFARLLRIDHVMGLHRLYWIPEGRPGDQGVYVRYPAEELYAILSVESHRNKAGIVGENLGIVPPEVNASMRRHNIHPMAVAQFEIFGGAAGDALREAPSNSVASLNTHDVAPFRAFLDATDVPDKLDLGFIDANGARNETKERAVLRKALVSFLRRKGFLKGSGRAIEDIFRAATKFLGSGPSRLVLVNIEDLWQEFHPQNVPATTIERPNWRRRLRYSVERIQSDRKIETNLRELDRVRNK